MRSKFLILFLIGLITFSQSSNVSVSADLTPNQESVVKRVIIMTIDAFRFDVLDQPNLPSLPGFEWILANGIQQNSIVPNPTLTATGHVSISAGANSDVHGIMGNTFYDWQDEQSYSLFDALPGDSDFDIRNTTTGANLLLSPAGYHWAVMNGKESMTIGWAYSEGKYERQYEPTVQVPFGTVAGWVDKLISQRILDELDSNPNLALVYGRFRGVDSASHYNPEFGDAFDTAIKGTDDALKVLLAGLQERDMLKDTMLILTGDHGWNKITNSDFNIEETTEFIGAVTSTGIDPIIAQDSGFSYMYFPGVTDTQLIHDFANALDLNPNVNQTFVNEEHIPLGMYNKIRGMNISVWYNSDIGRNFGSTFENMHGYLNTIKNMQAGLLMVGAGVDTTATRATQLAIDITPTALSVLGLDPIPQAQGVIMTDLLENVLGPDGADIPWLPEDTTDDPTSKEDDSPFPVVTLIASITMMTLVIKLTKSRN